MEDILDTILLMNNTLVSYGVNPLTIIFIIFFSETLKKTFKIYKEKHKKIMTMLTAIILGCVLSFTFLWLLDALNKRTFALNAIISIIASYYSNVIAKFVGNFFDTVKARFTGGQEKKK